MVASVFTYSAISPAQNDYFKKKKLEVKAWFKICPRPITRTILSRGAGAHGMEDSWVETVSETKMDFLDACVLGSKKTK